MIKSMTGFGRGETTAEGKTFVVEIKTVNHRYNDVTIKLPRFLGSLEDKIREYLLGSLSRGKIDVYISYSTVGLENKELIFDEELADKYFEILENIKDKYQMTEQIALSLVARFPDIVRLENKEEDTEELWNILKEALNAALKNLVAMRETEGMRLKEDVTKRLGLIKNTVKLIEERSPLVVEEYRQKLTNRINDLMKGTEVDPQRLAMEVAIMSDRSSIAEEITRLYSHIGQMTSTLDGDNIGRKLDFIVQEMNRESNTINSKASDITIINNIIEIKSEIEKIREQIQNIE